MPTFRNGDVEIAYLDEGEGDPIVLVHGFASSKSVNWVYPTWVSDLKKDGRRERFERAAGEGVLGGFAMRQLDPIGGRQSGVA